MRSFGRVDQLLGVVAGREQPAGLVVPEQIEQGVGGGSGLVDPAGLPGRLGQSGEGVDERGVVGGVSEVTGSGRAPSPRLPRPQPAPVGAPELAGRGTRRWPRRPLSQSVRPVAAAASAREASISAFHSVSTLSSRPGRIRCSRRSSSAWRASSISAGRTRSPRTGRTRMLAPSKLPVGRGAVPVGHRLGPRRAERPRAISSGDQT